MYIRQLLTILIRSVREKMIDDNAMRRCICTVFFYLIMCFLYKSLKLIKTGEKVMHMGRFYGIIIMFGYYGYNARFVRFNM